MDQCVLCGVVRDLEVAETCPGPSGGVFRKVSDLPSAVAVLGPDQFYRGYTLVIARRHATELYHLTDRERAQYLEDMVRVARAIDRAFQPRKMNYELLGNTVPHLHWHLFPRYADDPSPTRPTWEHVHESRALGETEAGAVAGAIRRCLA